ncbi:MAG: hypothetical protein HY744_09235 [Deltaproteobacteria bacterium]|nr:hypothetical protein [Deltaproteobacteria bacterium]
MDNLHRSLLLVPCAAAAAACQQPVEKPTPPDMSALVAAYANPSGTFDQAAVQEMVDTVTKTLNSFAELGIDGRLGELLGTLGDSVSGPESQPQGEVKSEDGALVIEGEAYLEITRICSGWGPEPKPDPANGTLTLNVNLTDIRLDPVLWAGAAGCRYRQEDVTVLLDRGSRRDVGDVRAYVGEQATLDNLGKQPIIVEVDVTATLQADAGGAAATVAFDVRLVPDPQTIEVRVPTSRGDLIAGSSSQGIVQVRASNGTFACDGSGRCKNDKGDEVQL